MYALNEYTQHAHNKGKLIMSPRSPGTLNRIEFLVLAVLSDGPRHGYGIVQEIRRRTMDEVSVRPGSLYRVLDRLVRMRLISPTDEGPSRDDERRTDYEITEQGRTGLHTEARLLSSVASDVLAGGERPA